MCELLAHFSCYSSICNGVVPADVASEFDTAGYCDGSGGTTILLTSGVASTATTTAANSQATSTAASAGSNGVSATSMGSTSAVSTGAASSQTSQAGVLRGQVVHVEEIFIAAAIGMVGNIL